MVATDQVVDAEPVSIWQTLGEQVAFANYVPVPISPDLVEEETFTRRSGDEYHVLKHRERRTYLSLPPDAYALWRMMDGQKPIRKIAVEYFMEHKKLIIGLLRGLVEEMRENGFLEDQPAHVFARLRYQQRRRTISFWAKVIAASIISRNLAKLRNGNAAFYALYRTVGWVLFTKPAVAAMWLVLVAGFGVWLSELSGGSHALVSSDSYLLSFLILMGLNIFAISLHELGHALAVVHKRREIIDVGVLLYYGAPCAYVNTTDIWMCDRRSRILVSWAGPFVTLFLAGVMGLVTPLAGASALGDFAFKCATVWFLNGVLNFIPLLELDGYFILVDLLEMPLLRARSFQFLRKEMLVKLRERSPWSREERILGTFGVLAAAFSGLALLLSAWAWNTRGVGIARELWALPDWWGKPLLGLLILVFGGPLLLGIVALVVGAVRWSIQSVRWRISERRLASRTDALVQAIPTLQKLGTADRVALAAHLQPRRVPAGAVVIRQGDSPDGFYFIRDGEATVERVDDRGEARYVATLGPGDHFGEMAYLQNAPRNATVRADTSLSLYYLDGGHFGRWLSEDLRGREEVRRRLVDQATLERLPLLGDLPPSERDQLMGEIGAQRFAAGEAAFEEGDAGDKLYLIVDGRFEILMRDAEAEGGQRQLAELGPGAYFGEIALLSDAPRNATVRALEPSTCYTLTREGFERVLDAAPANRAALDRVAIDRVREARAGIGTLVGSTR